MSAGAVSVYARVCSLSYECEMVVAFYYFICACALFREELRPMLMDIPRA